MTPTKVLAMRERLAKAMRDHRRNRNVKLDNGQWVYACVCGEVLESNSHYAQSKHQADEILLLIERGEE